MKMSDRPNTKNPRVSGLTNVKGNPLKKQLQMTTSQRKSKERFDVGSKERKREEKKLCPMEEKKNGEKWQFRHRFKMFFFLFVHLRIQLHHARCNIKCSNARRR